MHARCAVLRWQGHIVSARAGCCAQEAGALRVRTRCAVFRWPARWLRAHERQRVPLCVFVHLSLCCPAHANTHPPRGARSQPTPAQPPHSCACAALWRMQPGAGGNPTRRTEASSLSEDATANGTRCAGCVCCCAEGVQRALLVLLLQGICKGSCLCCCLPARTTLCKPTHALDPICLCLAQPD